MAGAYLLTRDGVEPRGGNGAIQRRGERQGVAVIAALDDIVAVQRHCAIPRRQQRSSRRAAEVVPDDARSRRISALRSKQAPPCPSAAKIGAIQQTPSPRREPACCAGLKRTQGFANVIVCPNNGISPRLDLPRRDVVAAQERTKQFALDVTLASLSLYFDQGLPKLDRVDDERVVASALHGVPDRIRRVGRTRGARPAATEAIDSQRHVADSGDLARSRSIAAPSCDGAHRSPHCDGRCNATRRARTNILRRRGLTGPRTSPRRRLRKRSETVKRREAESESNSQRSTPDVKRWRAR